jgi:hypothetical protein
VQARVGAPLAAHVDDVNVPYDPNRPTATLVVEPVSLKGATTDVHVDGVSTKRRGGDPEGTVEIERQTDVSLSHTALLSRQDQITRQLVSALSGVKNFRLVDYGYFTKNARSFSSSGAGPYLVRAVITEWNERPVLKQSRIDVPGVYDDKQKETEGMVALDVVVLRAATGEILSSWPVRGTFISSERARSVGFIAPVVQSEMQVKSAVDQALRVALNDAAVRLAEELISRK